jgi:replicative DNA helicase
MKINPSNSIMNNILDNISTQNKMSVNAISTGISSLDNLVGGWKPCVSIVSARPGMGLTAFALTQLRQVLSNLTENEVVIYVADKESSTALMQRLLSIATQLDLATIQKGKLNKEEFDKVLKEPLTRQLKDKKVVFLNSNTPTVYEIRHLVHSLKKEGKKPVMVFVDSLLSLVDRIRFRSQDMEQVMLDLNLLSEEYELPVLCTMPLGRQVEYRDSKYPRLSDLDAKMVNIASSVFFLLRPEYYEVIELPEEETGEAHLIIAKNEGPLDTIKLNLKRKSLTFLEANLNSYNNLTSS